MGPEACCRSSIPAYMNQSSPSSWPVHGIACNDAPPKEPSVVDRVVGCSGERIHALGVSLSELEQRLAPILRNVPVPNRDAGVEESTGCKLGDEILLVSSNIKNAHSVVLELLDRLGV